MLIFNVLKQKTQTKKHHFKNEKYKGKVKLKNLTNLLQAQEWMDVEGVKDVAICEFSYQAKSWQHSRVLKAMRSVKEYVEISYPGEKKIVPV
ncbi:MAG: hypothetical protein GH151_12660 [Bacteroidetes bacterium]|nr:hypothetical protein [Bacteroidota bacterium]